MGQGVRPPENSLADITNYPRPTLPHVLKNPVTIPQVNTAGQFLWWLIKTHCGQLSLAVVLAWVSFTAPLVAAYFLRPLIDDGLIPANPTATWRYGALMITALIVGTLAALSRHFVMSVLRNRARCLIIRTLTEHCTSTGAALTRKVGAGELATVQAVDLAALAHVLTAVGPGLAGALTIIGAATYLTSTALPLAVTILGGTALLSLAAIPLVRQAKTSLGMVRAVTGALNDRSHDLVHGLRVLTGIGGRQHFAADFCRESQAVQQASCAVAHKTVRPLVLKDLNGPLLLTVVLAVVVWVASATDISPGRVAEVVGYSSLLLTPMSFVNAGISRISAGLVAADRVVRVLAVRADFSSQPADQPTMAPTVADVVDQFGRAELVDPVSGLRLTPGVSYAVVGDYQECSAILARLARYTESTASLGEQPLADLPLPLVRQHVVYAEQSSFLFPGTLRDVITGANSVDAEWVSKVVHAAHLADVIGSRPGGLAAQVATAGRNFSGGQASRLRLARALYANPPVLLLDHPTHALDATTEAAVAARVTSLRGGQTTCVATNAPTWHTHVDQVVCIAQGRVHCQGTVTQVHQNPVYREAIGRHQ